MSETHHPGCRRRLALDAALACGIALAGTVAAQQGGGPGPGGGPGSRHGGGQRGMQEGMQGGRMQEGMSSAGPLHRAMSDSMQRMQSMQSSGDPDRDFATMMREHHRGGVEMARARAAPVARA